MASTTAAARQAAPAAPVTFSKDVAPILFDRCGACHHPDGIAPFSLITYEAARQRASLVALVTKRRQMPPWKSEPGYGEFVGHKNLTDAEIDLLQRWAASGAPEGDPKDLPPTPAWTAGWQLGQPDDVVSLGKPFIVPADGPNFSRTFIMPVSNPTVRYVKGLEFRPGNPAAVHHANIRVTTVRAIDGSINRSRGPSKLAFEAVYPDGHFLGWTPGQVAPLLPKGLAWRLEAGADLVVEIHFVPTGKPESVTPSIGLFYTDEPPERTPTMLRLGKQTIDIPAGQRDYVTTDSFVLPVDVEVLAVQPHAHYRAHEVVGTATLPDGTTKPLIYIKDWDFLWQHVYRYVTPLSLPKGTTLSMRITYDNSAANPRNPQLPPVRVRWGQQSTEEMGDIWVQLLARDERDLHQLTASIRPKHLTEDLVGFEALSRAEPNRVDTHNDIAVMRRARALADAAAHFAAVVKLQPDSQRALQPRHRDRRARKNRGGRRAVPRGAAAEAGLCRPTTIWDTRSSGWAISARRASSSPRRRGSIRNWRMRATTSARSTPRTATRRRRSRVSVKPCGCSPSGCRPSARWPGSLRPRRPIRCGVLTKRSSSRRAR